MNQQLTHCPHCGRSLTDEPTEPGLIRADDAALPLEQFSRIRLQDLTGDPHHDWPLIVARFQHTLPDLVELIYTDPAISRYVKEQAQPAQVKPSQLWQDLDVIRPHLPKIVHNGQFVYGHQSRIAEALGIPNQGSYRRRIQNVVSALQRTVIKNSTSTTAAPELAPGQPVEKRRAA